LAGGVGVFSDLAVTGWSAQGLYLPAELLDDQRFKLETTAIAALLEGAMEHCEERSPGWPTLAPRSKSTQDKSGVFGCFG
jgi:hypothetical protein